MAEKKPKTIEELIKIKGISSGKANKYGTPFLKLINEYEED